MHEKNISYSKLVGTLALVLALPMVVFVALRRLELWPRATTKTPVSTVSQSTGTCATEMVTSLSAALASPADVCVLDLMDQKITDLPPQIDTLVNLEEMHLGGTSMLKLPPEIGSLGKLRVLDLMDVPIETLPPELGNLRELRNLDIDDTGLTSFPEVIVQLKNLEVLNLAFVNVGHIPDSISQLTHLKELDVTGIVMTETDKIRLKNLLPNVTIIGLQ